MTNQTRVILFDIGTHKAQEARLIGDDSLSFAAETLIRLLRFHRLRPAAIRDFRRIRAAKNALRGVDFYHCFVEPVVYGEALRYMRGLKNFFFLNGVSSRAESAPATLHLAKENLGHSIIPSKPNLSGSVLVTWNYNFAALLDWINTNVRQSPGDRIFLRMNAEGVEREIIDEIHAIGNDSARINAFFGSLGDIKKCFGPEALARAEQQLRDMEIPFHYFTSSPGSWASALEALASLCAAPRGRT